MLTQYGRLLEQGHLLANRFEGGSLREGVLIGKRALNRIIMVPYIPIREKYTNILRLAFSDRLQMRGKNFCHAKTWERRSRNYQLSGASRGSRSHTVFPLKACLHEGGELQVGKVTCVAMLEKKPASSSSK